MNESDFKKKCIEIYGDFVENTYGLVLLKEDGEYRQISYPDKRYEILHSYIYNNHKERHAAVSRIGCGLQLKMYIEKKNYKLFPEAKPMEYHGKLEKEFLGERIAMMMAYYDSDLSFVFSNEPHPLNEYCLSLGWDLSIYIHRYINQPMDWRVYHDLKEKTILKMTTDEYHAYRKKADILINKGKEGWFDGWDNYLGNSYEEASNERKKKEVISFEDALKEVKEFDWKL